MKDKTNELAVSKIKRLKSGGLSVSYVEHVESDSGGVSNNEWSLKMDDVPHPDLVGKITDLKVYLAKCYGMLDVETVMNAKGLQAGAKSAFDKVKPHLLAMMKKTLDKIEVTGYSVSGDITGENDNRAVIITGKILQENGSKTSLNSPRIKFSQDVFKFEDDIKVIIDDLEEEVKSYITGEKKAQKELFEQTDNNEGLKILAA